MGKPSNEQKEALLQIAAEVIAGKRDPADLETHGIRLGNPIVGDEAKRMLLEELERNEQADAARDAHLRAASSLWSKMKADGAERGSRGRFEVIFQVRDQDSALALAVELCVDDWTAEITEGRDGQVTVKVLTRPLVLAEEVVVELARQMVICSRDFDCELLAIQPARRRPWWKFW